jgi:hypothetical protein
MPAGILRLATITEVMPAVLSRAFVETIEWPARGNEYADGTLQRSLALPMPRRSWKLATRLPADLLATLRAFVAAQGENAFWFYNGKETIPRFVSDPTGVSEYGRYRVRLASAWNQSAGPILFDSQVELIETIVPPPEIS